MFPYAILRPTSLAMMQATAVHMQDFQGGIVMAGKAKRNTAQLLKILVPPITLRDKALRITGFWPF